MKVKNRFYYLLIGAMSLLSGCNEEKQENHIPVIVENVKQRDIELYGEYVGRIRARHYVEIHARIEGYLERMIFEEGSLVKENQALFIINQDQLKAKVDKAKAQLKKDQAIERKAQRDLDRLFPLFEQKAVSQLDLDNAIAAAESAKANVAMSQADLAQAQLQLSYTHVTSPIEGYISQRNADIGTLVGPGSKSLLATVVASDTVLVDFSLTSLDYLKSKERDVELGKLDSTRSWQPYVTVTLADNTIYPLKGIVDFASPQVNPQTGTFGVRASLPNPDRKLLPGQFTKVKLLLDIVNDATVVPSKSVIIEKGGAYVFVMRPNGEAEKRFIETGEEIGNETVIKRGVIAGEDIVVEGQHKLQSGDLLEPIANKIK